MSAEITLSINGTPHQLSLDPETPLLYVLRNDLGLNAPKYGCGMEQCGACKVLVDGVAVPSCQLPVKHVEKAEIITLEGLGTAEEPHPLQEAFLEEQAGQCGFCTAGMIIAAQGLLNRTRYPSDDEIREALNTNLCRCGTYDRVRRAIKLRIGRPHWDKIYEIQTSEALPQKISNELPSSLSQFPELDSWIQINTDETITIFSGKVELGQGIKTALAQIAAEELDVDLSRIRVITADTQESPDEGGTTGSMSIETSGSALRFATVEARYLMLSIAQEQLEAQKMSDLIVKDGIITDPLTNRQTSYWQLMAGKRFGHQIIRLGQPKSPDLYEIVGQPIPRFDLVSKVTGGVSYVQDIRLPHMLHGRIVRPPGYHARLISVDIETIRQMEGIVRVIQNGSFLAVIAEREEQAISAANALQYSASWQFEKNVLPSNKVYEHLLNNASQSNLILDGTGVDDDIPTILVPENAVQTLSATFLRPYHMHASIGTSAAVAHWQDDKLTVWSHSQAVFGLQGTIAHVLGLNQAQIRVIHVDGAGCYGHNGADDAALDAALLAMAVPDKPVSVKWSRADEHAWEPYGSAMVLKMQASLNDAGQIIDWNHDIWSYTHSTRPRLSPETSGLLASWHLEKPFPQQQGQPVNGSHFGSHRNADPKYVFSRKRIVRHFVPDSPLRVSALRSLGAYANIFAIESFMDELAYAGGIDPLEFRLRHLDDERAKAVISAAGERAGWQAHTRPANDGHGWGIAFAQYKNRQCYAAIAVEVTVNPDSGVIQLGRVIIAADAGQVVNPDGLSNQLEGGFVQAASWTLFEQVKFDEKGITSLDWDSYPILQFVHAPVIETILLNRPEMPFMGSGEGTQNPTPAAIANAVYHALGIRLREIPFTPERVLEALSQRE